jgi:plasmid maintenance system antidote protein VapI
MAPNILLKNWIAKADIANAEAARRVGYDRSNFHRILSGTAKPTMELAHSIETMTGGAVPMSAWIGFEPDTQSSAAA